MRHLKTITLAICIGIIGGMAVTIFSYYLSHREGGIVTTLRAVADSANRISEAYEGTMSRSNGWSMNPEILAGGRLTSTGGEFIDNRPTMDNSVLAAFAGIGEENGLAVKLGNIFDKGNSSSDLIKVNDDTLEDNPYGDILRFHVRANSDSDNDQELKLAVRDDVIALLEPLVSDCGSVSESKRIIINNLQNIHTTAVNTIVEQGYDYPVKAYVTVEDFPEKTYGDVTLPAGKYQALRIDIGNAQGHNWWCVMYPPLCFIDETTAVVDDKGKEILKENLSPEAYKALFENEEIRGKSLLYEKIKEWFDGDEQ
ncbi:MAG: stage II sporulation protein R [Lachnospiraceae bacterium]|nr:stage II sporulation protein R [Lachnospiraceae bacterium]